MDTEEKLINVLCLGLLAGALLLGLLTDWVAMVYFLLLMVFVGSAGVAAWTAFVLLQGRPQADKEEHNGKR